MAGVPKKPEEIFAEFTADFQKLFGSDLLSVCLYGSGARHDYVPGKSDINFLVVLTEEGINGLKKVFPILPRWRKRRVAIPLVMTKSFMASSMDVYPIEFLNMKRNYVPVFGEDVLAEMAFDRKALRLQVERELKGKTLLLRMRYLGTEGKSDRLESLIKESITAFISIFNALLYMAGVEIPKGRAEVVQAAAKAFAISPEAFLKCVQIREGRGSFAPSEMEDIFQGYLKELVRLTDIVDKMNV